MAEKTINYIKLPDGETYKIGGSGSGFNLFDTKVSDHVLEGEEALGFALQGTYVYKEAVAGSRYGYPDFYNRCLEEKEQGTATEITLGSSIITMYINGNGHKFYDIADKDVVDAWYNTYGIADFYGVDTENERIFLPRNDKFIQLTGDTSKVNDCIEAGLPNITGSVTTYNSASMGTSFTGAFTSTQVDKGGVSTAAGTGREQTINIDASRSSSVYGNSDTVQPPSSLKLLYYCVGNTKVESAVSNVTEITTSENDTLPLFYNFYSQEDMTTTGAYVNASLASWLSGNVYTTAYNELVNKLGTDNVKANTDTYTDYDFVVNQDDMTFRLPLLNGDENVVDYSKATAFELATNFTAPANGVIHTTTNANAGSGSWYWTINGGEKNYLGANSSGRSPVTVLVSKGDVFYINGATDSLNTLYFYPYKGNGNLYYKLSNAVTNLEILDAGKVMNALNTVVPNNASLISSYGMPSNNWISLTLGSAGSNYTAPANGYVLIRKFSNAIGQHLTAFNNSGIGDTKVSSIASQALWVWFPVKKGETFHVNYTAGGTTELFRFIYAEGDK